MRVFQLDSEKALGREWDSWLATEGITENRTIPYIPDQNGAAERSGGVIFERARSIQIDSKLPDHLWPEIVCAAGYISNRLPQQEAQWKTPIERLQAYKQFEDPKPYCSYIQVYRCKAYTLKYKIPKTEKLVPRAYIGYLVGYDSTNIF